MSENKDRSEEVAIRWFSRKFGRSRNWPRPSSRAHGRGGVYVGILAGAVLLVLLTPSWAQSLPQAAQQQKAKQAPVHIKPGSATTVPGGVTPQQAPIPPPSAKPAAQHPQGAAHIPLIKANVNLVLVPVVVTDPLNRMVTGLQKQFFTVAEDGAPQEIQSFSSEDAPISVGVVFDSSGSMADKIQESRDALIQFFKTANPQDEFFLVDFADEPRMLCGFTSNIDEIEDSVTFLHAGGRTALLDAIYLALEEMRHAKYARKALLIISDGGDNHSRYSERDIERVVREADVQIYGIGIYSPFYSRATPEEINGPELLDKITEATGGKTFEIQDTDELADTATKIGIELRNEYMIGYSSTDKAADGKWRKIDVKLHPPPGLPPLTVSARTGYYGPHL